MTATITDQFKRELTQELRRDYDSGDNYYIVIGRTEQWGAVDTQPDVSQVDYLQSPSWSKLTRNAFQASKLATKLSYVIPRYNWTSGTIYHGYNDDHTDHDDDSKKYYVLNDQNQVYMCLRAGVAGGVFVDPISGKTLPNPSISTVQPTGGLNGVPFKTGDGYFWKFMYTISVADTDNFVTSKFIPVKFVDSAGVDDVATDIQQKAVQDNTVPKSIVGFEVLDAGSGNYSSPPSVTITGANQVAAAGVARIDGNGYLISVEIDSDGVSTGWQFGSGYDNASVLIDDEPGIVRPIFSPKNGIGADPTIDLRATQLMFNVQLAGNEDDTIIPFRPGLSTFFRQISLLKNPTTTVNDSDYFTGLTGNNLNSLTTSSPSGAFTPGDFITGGTSTASAIVDHYYDSSDGITTTGYMWYHQNDSSGYGTFQIGDVLSRNQGGATGTVATFVSPDIDNYSGELLYVDNRAEIPRDDESRQDLKIVITF